MSDPLDRLGDLGAGIDAPDVGAIRSRARRIQQRRRVAVGASAGVALAAVVVIAAVALPGGGSRDVATTADVEGSPPAQAPLAAEQATGDAVSAEEGLPERSPAGEEDAALAEPLGGTGASADAAAPEARATEQPPLEVTVLVSSQATSHTFTLRVCNPGDQTARRGFGDAQRFDFEVYDGGQDPVWRWSEGRMFAQVIGGETWKPGECREDWSATWQGTDGDGDPVAPGNYQVVGVLTAFTPERSEPVEVCHVTCG